MPLIFDAQDQTDIQNAINAGGRIWYNAILDRLKRKIKDHFILEDISKCCYCSRLFQGEFRMVIDIEHILPQSLYGTERFEVNNLNVACKRCNMEIKNNDVSFLNNTINSVDYYNKDHYKFIHPNLEAYNDHLELYIVRKGNNIYNKYHIKNQGKGLYTYTYFELKNLEIDTYNRVQGLTEKQTLSSKIRGVVRNNLLSLITKI